ncbi:antibiotic biosynthesis monooxygenase family protein [Aurantimonas sp. 22II-16-19i]|uniref:antibiotic biosynthesis monooxygenase family protein n=1 Tax=Aurantimonas sp. 22II-16-19i TaxID=1317114 RepID=UPI0009F7CB41|nr:antibiotic biosynthesis monooxygenase family protein [Aurantimonas sp. 22II-16-19i]ORE90485.1 Antibiotic biosynthesis monooxygenase [Aurantimonas sp. 22II-16-19i]
MLRLKALDETLPLESQLAVDQAPVVLVNLFEVDACDAEALMRAWEADANWMKRQPGYISTQLHGAVGGGRLFLNYAVWESVAHFRAAFSHPEFTSALAHYPSSATAAPHLFRKLPVANLCTA